MSNNDLFLVDAAMFCPYRAFGSCLLWDSEVFLGSELQRARNILQYRAQHKCRNCLIGFEFMQKRIHANDALDKRHIIPKDKRNQDWFRKVLVLKPDAVQRCNEGSVFSIHSQLVLAVDGAGCYRLDNGSSIDCMPVFYMDDRVNRMTVYRSEVLGLASPEAIRYYLRSFIVHNYEKKYYKALEWLKINLIKYGGDVSCLRFDELMREECELEDTFVWHESNDNKK